MAKIRRDEILGKVGADEVVVPRYDVVDSDGKVLHEDVKLVLKNEVVQEGMAVDKTAMDECLAASGIARGTKKQLILDQENFVLFDGALVRFRLFDVLSGASTLNVNNTGAKRIKTTFNEDPEDIVADDWIDVIYSQKRDQYILVGGGGGNAALSQSINLLEEVVDMKYCKVISTNNTIPTKDAEWLSLGVLKATCETDNYFWYCRIRALSNFVEMRRVHKTTGEVEEFNAASHNSAYFPVINVGSYYLNISHGKMLLTPLRGGDAVLFTAVCSYSYRPDSNNTYFAHMYVQGVVFPDKKPYVRQSNTYANTNNNNQCIFHTYPFHTLNGVYDAETGIAYIAIPPGFGTTSGNNYTNGSLIACHYIIAIDGTSGTVLWQKYLSTNMSYFEYSYGTPVWIVNATTAIAFNVIRYASINTQSMSQNVPVACKVTIDASGNMTYTTIGSNFTYPLGGNILNSGNYCGWKYKKEEPNKITLMAVASAEPKSAGTDATRITEFTVDISAATLEVTSYKVGNWGFAQNISFIDGYIGDPLILLLPHAHNLTGVNYVATFAVLYNYITGESTRFVNATTLAFSMGTIYPKGSYTWNNLTGPGALSTSIVEDNLTIVDTDGAIIQRKLDVLDDPTIITWTCPEDGVYKIIAVGGGESGGNGFGGGAGYLQIATVQLVTGDKLKCKVGTGGVYTATTAIDQVLCKSRAQASYVLLEEDPNNIIIYAHPAKGNQGGATGAATPNGGGAGGYDLVMYGGQGMNFCSNSSTQLTVSAEAATISVGNIALSKDRNGGVSSNAGACTSGDGYGAGGAMNQNGKDGCIVIIR